MSKTSVTPAAGFTDRLMSLYWRKPADDLPERTRRKVAFHLIPYLFFLYVLAYLDRVNVGVAALGMEKSPAEDGLGFSEDVIGFAAGIFFLSYWILEVPSTVSVVRWGARYVFVRILILWGICAALAGAIGTPFASSLFSWLPHLSEQAAFVTSVDGALGASPMRSTVAYINGLHDNAAYQLYFFRFMLGFFEGGFFPSVIVYLSLWFRAGDRAKAIAAFMSAIPLSSMLGTPLSGLLLKVNWLGLAGWRWIFILEGIAPVLAGIATLFFLPNRPAQAKWLSAEERDWLTHQLEQEHKAKAVHGHGAWVRHLGLVLLLTTVYFCLNVSSYGLGMFMPKIIKAQSGLSDDRLVSFLAALPYAASLVGILFNGWHSDRSQERIWHVAVPLSLMSFGFFLAAMVDGMTIVPVVVMILCVGTFMHAHLPSFWPIPTMFLGATAAASAIGFINMIGNLGGFVGPAVFGSMVENKAFQSGLLWLSPWPLVAALIILVVGYVRRQRPVTLP
jgi:MFS family permease